jgi:hypothetical protein
MLSCTAEMLRPRLDQNNRLHLSMKVTISDDDTIVHEETLEEQITPGTDVPDLAEKWKPNIQAMLDKCQIESDAMAKPEYAKIAETAKAAVSVKGIKQ